MNQLLEHLSILDVYALVWFIVCWVGYSFVADHTPLKRYSVSTAMAIYRRQWMCQMIEREIRIYDAQLQGNLLQGMVFFSTTTILAIGGLLALLGLRLQGGRQSLDHCCFHSLSQLVPTTDRVCFICVILKGNC